MMMKRNGETLKNRERCIKKKSFISSEKREIRVLKGKTENKWKLEFEIKKIKMERKIEKVSHTSECSIIPYIIWCC